jgi:tetratricopeptide (TPR) repeat protein
MLLQWFNSRDVSDLGVALADDFVLQTAPGPSAARPEGTKSAEQGKDLRKVLSKFLQRVDREARPLQLNAFKKAKLATSFKWRLLEKGAEPQVVDELTQALVMRLSVKPSSDAAASAKRPTARDAQSLLAEGDKLLAEGAFDEAARCYEDVLRLDPRQVGARNNLGAAFCKLGRYQEAEHQFRRAIALRAGFADAHSNLGTVLRWTGRATESEMPLRRALNLKPASLDAQISLGTTLLVLGRLRDAWVLFEKALNVAPRNVNALVGMGQIAAFEGRPAEAETLCRRALEVDPKSPGACSVLVRVRRMTSADHSWFKDAEAIAASGLAPLEEADIRYAIGKYCDDIGDFPRAFRSYQRGNELQKMAAETFDRDAHTRLVDDLIRVFTREALSVRAGASDSERPVFVVGMMRSGTSLVEQIIASHPSARGAGELQFWRDAVRKHEATVRHQPPGEPLRRKLATAYLRDLRSHSADALRVVDKATVNSDYLGVIHSVFPNARMIYLRRDPIDTCLSCYFQPFSPALNFTMDLSDLAHYYGEHQRLMAHWRRVLPAETLLDVPYAALVADQEAWTRKIVDFLGLNWDERCLDFHKTQRTVLTASSWQVRQKIHNNSVGRWRNYQKFIGPLLALRDTVS